MKTDSELEIDILESLDWEPGIDATAIDVTVKDGVVTLRGVVRSYFDRSIAERATRHVRGVRAIANDITVGAEGVELQGDTEIAEAVANALAWDTAVPMNAITATVTDGWVTLTGMVEWQYQKSVAQIAAERIFGVKGVVNLVTLKPRATSTDVKAKIESAFKRSAVIDAARVHVDARDGTVILTGTVKSLTERDEIERAAWCAPGVMKVDDRITVSPF